MPVERLILHGSESMMTIANNRATGFGYARRWGTVGGTAAASERMEHAGLVTGAAWSPDGGRVVTIGDDGFARVWWTASTEAMEERISPVKANDSASRASTNEAKPEASPSDPVPDSPDEESTLATGLSRRSPDGRWLVTTKHGDERGAGEATLWNLATKQRAGSISTNLPITDIAFAHDSALFAVAGGSNMSGSVRVFTMLDAQPVGPAFSASRIPLKVSFAPGANRVAVGFANDPMEDRGKFGVIDTRNGLPLIEARFGAEIADTLRFSPDGQRLTVDSELKSHVWDVPTPASPAPDWLAELARVVARRELGAASTVERIRTVGPRLDALRTKVRASPDSPAKAVALMVLAKPGERPISPFSRQTRRERLEQDVRDWTLRADEAMRGSEESDILSLLQEARGLSHRTFGDTTLLASMEAARPVLRQKMLALLSSDVATIEKSLDLSHSTWSQLCTLRELETAELAFAAQVAALQERFAKARQKINKARPQ